MPPVVSLSRQPKRGRGYWKQWGMRPDRACAAGACVGGESMGRSKFKRRLPGHVATGLVILTTTLWTFWGMAEMYYEGWGLPFPE